MITITKKQVIDLEPGDVVGDEERAWYRVLLAPVRASRAKGCQVRVQHIADGGIDTREWDDEHTEVPVRAGEVR